MAERPLRLLRGQTPMPDSIPALYTPAAMARIRALSIRCGADVIAAELGWTLADVQARARRHGIELTGASETKPPTEAEPESTCARQGFTWRPASKEIHCRGIVVKLVDGEAAIFSALLRADGPRRGRVLCPHMAPGVLTVIVARLRKKLHPLGARIESVYGNRDAGGYRLRMPGEGK